ncbi:ankyrin repeat domain-containing protein [Flavobacterium sp. UMI-01]|uniref:ankyrin repeat domain-containing protein n=1 Tax=Flavobacterium sp. UMI-01 TaxID=1441053 RepID=UPI001C7CAADA|nr:ankyrin repeat domain-containing protein [Flavobacterium sp. UMI-01]GIZ07626.1 hypothetical protein FUMI01_03530 [Flavobacterium sp. UMI-01]
MNKKFFIYCGLLTSVLASAQQKNSLLNPTFWKPTTEISMVQNEISKGNNPSESNDRAFDPVVYAINNDAPVATIQFLLEQPGNSVNKSTHDNRNYLHWASYKGNLPIVNYLIAKGANINLEDSHGTTPLTFAASAGVKDTALYETFFKAGIDPKKKNKEGATLLMLAIAGDKDLELTQYFITKGLSLKDMDNEGNTVVNYVARTGNIELMKKLIQKGIKPTDNALLMAAQGSRRESNTLEVFQFLIEEAKLKPTTTNKEGETVLHYLVRKPNQNEIINYFLKKGVNPNQANNEGTTPLMLAASGRDTAALEQLLPIVNNKNAVNTKGESALTMAVKSGTSQAVALLLTNGVNPNVIDKDGNNLAFHLIQSYQPQTGREIDAKQDSFTNKTQLLQEKGFDITTPQKDGSTLYHIAILKNDLALLKKITALQLDINHKNQDGLTVLHKAAMIAKDDSLLKYLLSLGAKKDITTEFGETAYALAKENETLTKNNTSVEFLK